MPKHQLDPKLTVNEIVRRYPETVAVFNRMGVDLCCGGGLTLAEAIDADGIDEDDLREALDEALASAPASTVAPS